MVLRVKTPNKIFLLKGLVVIPIVSGFNILPFIYGFPIEGGGLDLGRAPFDSQVYRLSTHFGRSQDVCLRQEQMSKLNIGREVSWLGCDIEGARGDVCPQARGDVFPY